MMPAATRTEEQPTDPDQNPDLDRVFRAMADPTRRAIITQLAHGEATMTKIADQFDMSLPGVSKHVGVLEEAGLVRRWRSGRSRRCRLVVQNMQTANAWITSQTRYWEQSLDALAAFVEEGEAGR